MSTMAERFRPELQTDSVLDSLVAVIAGLGFTGGLFWAIAHFERDGSAEAPVEIADLQPMALPLEPPPPRIIEQTEVVVPVVEPFAGLEVGASESPVKIAVVPPDLEMLMPHSDVPPAAGIQVAQFHSDLKPKLEVEADFSRVFNATEVDQRPRVLSRPNPFIPPNVRGKAKMLRVLLLITVDTTGLVHNVRVLNPSGNEQFDAIILESVRREWAFTPAIKKGRKVKCLLQQSVAVTWRGSGSRFEL